MNYPIRRVLAIRQPVVSKLIIAIVIPCNTSGQVTSTMLDREVVSIDTLEIEKHARILSHDSLKGRATGTAGIQMAASYIISVCSDLGLRPAGPEYRLPLDLARARIRDETSLQITIDGQTGHFIHDRDFIINTSNRKTLRSFAGYAELVGTEADIRSNASATTRTPRVAVTLGTVSIGTSQMLLEQGVTAMVHLSADTNSFDIYRHHLGAFRVFAADSQVESSYALPLPSLIASPDLSGLLFQSLRAGANPRLRFDLETDVAPLPAENVGCRLPGRDPNTGAIAFTAHYDHLGVGPPNATGDSVYNGFSDNAAGVAMLLAIAKHAARAQAPPRSDWLFLFFTGEELGLLGSDGFVAQPPIPLATIQAVINLDAGAPPAPPNTWRLAGGQDNPLGTLAAEVAAARYGRVTFSPAVPNSDYYPFARSGVQAIFVIPGPGDYDGLTADSSAALRARWDRYHLPDDEWHPGFPFAGLGRYAEFAYAIARAVDRADSSLEREENRD